MSEVSSDPVPKQVPTETAVSVREQIEEELRRNATRANGDRLSFAAIGRMYTNPRTGKPYTGRGISTINQKMLLNGNAES